MAKFELIQGESLRVESIDKSAHAPHMLWPLTRELLRQNPDKFTEELDRINAELLSGIHPTEQYMYHTTEGGEL